MLCILIYTTTIRDDPPTPRVHRPPFLNVRYNTSDETDYDCSNSRRIITLRQRSCRGLRWVGPDEEGVGLLYRESIVGAAEIVID